VQQVFAALAVAAILVGLAFAAAGRPIGVIVAFLVAGIMAALDVALEVPKEEPPIAVETATEPAPAGEAVSRPSTSLWSRLTGWLGGV
jgi:hypothetical protein